MAFTYGFYNSLRGDRKYNAEQVSELFDGILKDGIIPSQGQLFAVSTANNGMQINVGTGRAWFNHTWSKNDSVMVLTVPQSDITRPRYDAVVLEIDHNDSVRANSIKVVQGTAATNPVKPTLVNNDKVHQYPLAWILVPAAAETITASNIENAVGLEPTVFATGVLESVSIDQLWAQWQGDWTTWFEGIKLQLSGDVVTNLQLQIDSVRKDLGTTDGIKLTGQVANFLGLESGATLSDGLLAASFDAGRRIIKLRLTDTSGNVLPYGIHFTAGQIWDASRTDLVTDGTSKDYEVSISKASTTFTIPSGYTDVPSQSFSIPASTSEITLKIKMMSVNETKNFYSSTSIKFMTNMTLDFLLCGGGGGGGGNRNYSSNDGVRYSGGGGGGGYVNEYLSRKITRETSLNITVGAGGNGGSGAKDTGIAADTSGKDGGATTVTGGGLGATLTAAGGKGGGKSDVFVGGAGNGNGGSGGKVDGNGTAGVYAAIPSPGENAIIYWGINYSGGGGGGGLYKGDTSTAWATYPGQSGGTPYGAKGGDMSNGQSAVNYGGGGGGAGIRYRDAMYAANGGNGKSGGVTIRRAS